eukprot:g10871.t1
MIKGVVGGGVGELAPGLGDVGYVERSLFRTYTGPKPHLFLGYIDCISAALCSQEELEQFILFTNTFHPNLKFTWTISNTSL